MSATDTSPPTEAAIATAATPRSAEATRELLLATATEMIFEHPGATGLDTIRLADVVHRAGRTIGSAYQIWGRGQGQAAFRRELTTHVARIAVTDPTSTIVMLRSLPSGTTLEDLLAAVADHYVGLFESNGASWSVGLSLLAAAPYTDELREILLDEFATIITQYGEVFDDLLTGWGLRMKAPFDTGDLVTTLNAIVNGFFLRERLDPGSVVSSGDPARRRNLLAVTIGAVVTDMTEPLASAPPS